MSLVENLFERALTALGESVRAMPRTSGDGLYQRQVTTGTTVIAMRFGLKVPETELNPEGKEDAMITLPAVVIASDGRTSAGHHIVEEEAKKMRMIDSTLVLGGAGLASALDRMGKIYSLSVAHYDDMADTPDQKLSLRGKVTMLQNMMRQVPFLPIYFLLAGYEGQDNEDKGRCRIFEFYPGGYIHDVGDCGGTGSGYSAIEALLAVEAGRDYTLKELYQRLARLFHMAFRFDSGSGGTCHAYIMSSLGPQEVSFHVS
ncbi:MAG: hypothetical protein KGI50_03680 [Patescibacteria group bacterium]|nr:hypothetical protein [Patescibacteria group bacterium]MDE2438391.1 hypothetical protein [Patescibacteria group bacterium]